jgi:hypothetical protein
MANTDSTAAPNFFAGIVIENGVVNYKIEGDMSSRHAGAAATALIVLANAIVAEAREVLFFADSQPS